MTNDELYNKLLDIACDTSCIRDLCKYKGDVDSPVYRRADDATNKVQALLDIIEKQKIGGN